mmetsp:Transcript_30986/g.86966  ORF Transcript_30986/g.86966 Transcript_30986/m.86966 type:complete len:473 (-) Transcript_30986:156-1574(-)
MVVAMVAATVGRLSCCFAFGWSMLAAGQASSCPAGSGSCADGGGADDDAAVIAQLIGTSPPEGAKPGVVRALRLLAEQSTKGIDYKTLGLGWEHPTARTEYRRGEHRSFTHAKSKARSETSREALNALLKSCEGVPADGLERAVVDAFVREIGLPHAAGPGAEAKFEPVFAALEGELLLPLRALVEGQQAMHNTFNGWAVPPDKVAVVCEQIVTHVLKGDYSEWRYSNPVGTRQLEGLSQEQLQKWREPTRVEHEGGIATHEDAPGELGLFWATKIGGPSHGFDIEGQCLLPLLANARHKVVLVSDPDWPHHPCGRAHFRFLWTDATPPVPMLWLETVNSDFVARVDSGPWRRMVLRHVVGKAEAMKASPRKLDRIGDGQFVVNRGAIGVNVMDFVRVRLAVETHLQGELESVVKEFGGTGAAAVASNRFMLRPSNGVVEASDYLSDKHDWVQLEEEVTHAMRRCIYTPVGA